MRRTPALSKARSAASSEPWVSMARQASSAGAVEGTQRSLERTVSVDGAAGILDDNSLEARGTRVERAPGDAEVQGQAAQVDRGHAALAQQARQAGRRLAVGFEEGRVAVGVRVEALADHRLRLRYRQLVGKARAESALHAMVGPQHLLAVGQVDRRERHPTGMRRGERDVPRRMPVLRQDDLVEVQRDAVDRRDHLVPARHRQRAAGQEVILDVDDQQGFGRRHDGAWQIGVTGPAS